MRVEPPIPQSALRDLFERLDQTSMTGYQCGHTFAVSNAFLRERGFHPGPMLEWLGENGAGCDCEVMMNTAGQWAEAVGYQSPGDDA